MESVKKLPFERTFSRVTPAKTIIPTYKLARPDSDGNRELVQTGKVDIVEMVQSAYVNSLDYILDRFLDQGVAPDQLVSNNEDQSFLVDALMVNSDYIELMESARERYNLGDDMSYNDIRAELQRRYDATVKPLHNKDKKMEDDKNEDQTSQEVE